MAAVPSYCLSIGHSHCTPTQLERHSIFSGQELVMFESGRRRGMGWVSIEFGGLPRVVESASERANRTKVQPHRNSRATSLASRCGFCFHGTKSFVEKS